MSFGSLLKQPDMGWFYDSLMMASRLVLYKYKHAYTQEWTINRFEGGFIFPTQIRQMYIKVCRYRLVTSFIQSTNLYSLYSFFLTTLLKCSYSRRNHPVKANTFWSYEQFLQKIRTGKSVYMIYLGKILCQAYICVGSTSFILFTTIPIRSMNTLVYRRRSTFFNIKFFIKGITIYRLRGLRGGSSCWNMTNILYKRGHSHTCTNKGHPADGIEHIVPIRECSHQSKRLQFINLRLMLFLHKSSELLFSLFVHELLH